MYMSTCVVSFPDRVSVHGTQLSLRHMAVSLSSEDESFLRAAIALADDAVARGDHPFGAVIVARTVSEPTGDRPASSSASIVVRSMNSVNTQRDPTGHAETNAVRSLASHIAAAKSAASSASSPDASSTSYELFTSTEPCVMCCGAIYWSWNISRVVYACPESLLAKHAGDDFLCPCRDTFARGKRVIRVEGPFLADLAELPHASYWK